VTDDEIASIRAEVERLAQPLTGIALMWLYAHPERGEERGLDG
jgi:hypothetical protein